MNDILIEPVPGVKIAPFDLALLWMGLRGMGVSRPDLDGKNVSLRSATRRAVDVCAFDRSPAIEINWNGGDLSVPAHYGDARAAMALPLALMDKESAAFNLAAWAHKVVGWVDSMEYLHEHLRGWVWTRVRPDLGKLDMDGVERWVFVAQFNSFPAVVVAGNAGESAAEDIAANTEEVELYHNGGSSPGAVVEGTRWQDPAVLLDAFAGLLAHYGVQIGVADEA